MRLEMFTPACVPFHCCNHCLKYIEDLQREARVLREQVVFFQNEAERWEKVADGPDVETLTED